MTVDGSIPPGRAANPSRWSRRMPLIGVALVGVGIATYLGLAQLGVVAAVWDPFFADGSRRVLHSSLARRFPVPDALLGGFAYVVEAITGALGDDVRWRSSPWTVVAYAVVVLSLGAVSIGLVVSQPLVAQAWCTLCLASAVTSLVPIPFAVDEALATIAEIGRRQRRGLSLWNALTRRHAAGEAGARSG